MNDDNFVKYKKIDFFELFLNYLVEETLHICISIVNLKESFKFLSYLVSDLQDKN